METVLFATLIWQFVDFLRELVNLPATKSSVLTQLTAWVAGITLIAIAAHAEVAAHIRFPGLSMELGDLDGWSVILVGLLAASLASTGVDLKQAFDNGDSATKPPLVNPPA